MSTASRSSERRLIALAVLVLAALAAARPVRAADAVLQQAESTAVRYMKAFFAIDMKTVVALTYPEVFSKFDRQFSASLDQAVAQGRAEAFLHQNGLDMSAEQARALPVEEIYASVIRANGLRAPQAYRDQVRDIAITVAKGKRVDDRTALVMLRLGFPGGDRFGTLELKLDNDHWLVAGNARNF